MKKLLIAAIISISVLSSCTAECDTSSAEGASTCLCELMDQMLLASDDSDKLKELQEKQSTYKEEIKQAYDDGKYTENELEDILKDRNCYF
tara:strand:+ start:141 stop:413 length:273 start_codon:yes stop_codon:yes gene_type:complete